MIVYTPRHVTSHLPAHWLVTCHVIKTAVLIGRRHENFNDCLSFSLIPETLIVGRWKEGVDFMPDLRHSFPVKHSLVLCRDNHYI